MRKSRKKQPRRRKKKGRESGDLSGKGLSILLVKRTRRPPGGGGLRWVRKNKRND